MYSILADYELRDLIEQCDRASDVLAAVIERDLADVVIDHELLGAQPAVKATVPVVVNEIVRDVVTDAVVAIVGTAADALAEAAHYLATLREERNAATPSQPST